MRGPDDWVRHIHRPQSVMAMTPKQRQEIRKQPQREAGFIDSWLLSKKKELVESLALLPKLTRHSRA